jgi:hypothetical protein
MQDNYYEKSVVLTVNQDLQQYAPTHSLPVESDADSSQEIFTTPDFVFPLQTVATFVVFPLFNRILSGSKTYLITQRIRR